MSERRAAGRRVVLRRMDKLPILLAAISTVGLVGAAVTNWRDPEALPMTSSVLAAILVLCYLGGPAAYVVVTPSILEVANPFVRYRIPRRRIVDYVDQGWSELRLRIDDGSRVVVAAVVPGLTQHQRQPHHVLQTKVNRLRQLIDQVPDAPCADPVRRQIRYDNIALVVIAGAAFVSAGVYLYLTARHGH